MHRSAEPVGTEPEVDLHRLAEPVETEPEVDLHRSAEHVETEPEVDLHRSAEPDAKPEQQTSAFAPEDEPELSIVIMPDPKLCKIFILKSIAL